MGVLYLSVFARVFKHLMAQIFTAKETNKFVCRFLNGS